MPAFRAFFLGSFVGLLYSKEGFQMGRGLLLASPACGSEDVQVRRLERKRISD
jgi:hypothetical protein